MTTRAPQARSLAARQKIVAGAIDVLARGGVSALTHRAVAQAAGVSLASTTYHFEAKRDILEAASRHLLEGYLADFERVSARLATGQNLQPAGFDALLRRVTATALGPARARSLAWCEIMLHGGRSPEGRALAQDWYQRLGELWCEIGARYGTPPDAVIASLDRVVGMTFLLHPLQLGRPEIAALLEGRTSLDALPQPPALPAAETLDQSQPRGRILIAALEILRSEGASALTHRAVAERAQMVRSGPSYHFPTIEGLLRTSETQLAWRARQRYREGMEALGNRPLDADRLIDLTTTIFLREALEFHDENLGAFSAWIAAARAPARSDAVAAQIFEINRGWSRKLAAVGTPEAEAPRHALTIHAGFIGRLIQNLSSGRDLARLARLRETFAQEIGGALGGAPK